MKTLHLAFLYVLALALSASFVVITGSGMPEHVATHFGGDGRADGFMSRDNHVRFMLAITIGLPLMITGMIAAIPRVIASLVSLLKKERHPAGVKRPEYPDILLRHGLGLGFWLTVLSAGIHWLLVLANRSEVPRLQTAPFIILVTIFLVTLACWNLSLLHSLRKLS